VVLFKSRHQHIRPHHLDAARSCCMPIRGPCGHADASESAAAAAEMVAAALAAAATGTARRPPRTAGLNPPTAAAPLAMDAAA